MDNLETNVTETPVEAPETQQATEEQQPESTEQQQTITHDQLSNEDQDLISNFTKYFGEPKKGQEIVMHQGKPSLFMYVNGKPTVKPLQSVFDEYSMSEAASDKLLQVKIKEKEIEAKHKEAQEMVNTLVNNPKAYANVLKSAGYTENQIADIMAEQLKEYLNILEQPEEVRRAMTLEEENKALKAEKEERLRQQKEIELKAQEQKEYDTYKTELYQAMVDNDLTEEKPEVVEDIILSAVFKMKEAKKHNIDIKANDAVKMAINDLNGYVAKSYKGLSDHQVRKVLLEALGVERFNRVMKGDFTKLADIPTANSLASNFNKEASETATNKKQKKKTFAEVFG